MFKKILIANRGEIACRVIRTAKKMGIKTVAVYSDADDGALHAKMADEAVHIGKSPSNESYLVQENILKAIKDTGAEAVHPGYGFLSENASFCENLKKNNIAFIGPDIRAIDEMGDKIRSKKIAKDAGVSTVPGHPDPVYDVDEAVKIAKDVGYPVMLKASAGGGGKGMRLAYTDDEVRSGLVSAMNEAKSSFGDDRVFIEKFIEEPRHIEIQILADTHGNVLYLGERECSVQRRHQKVLEESPSPFIDPDTRKKMGEQAVMLAKAVDYVSAGTVEFIVDKNKNFYFLEMNTRLQVEHPVTEYVTGIDLVEWMLRIANGEKLDIQQQDIQLKGWALEARIYAEDPTRGFLPSTGRLSRLIPPQTSGDIRLDTGVVEGSEISVYYDPMIAKLITYADTRPLAIEKMILALNEYVIEGVRHNIGFLTHLVNHAKFRDGMATTNFIGDEYPDGLDDAHLIAPNPHQYLAIEGAAYILSREEATAPLQGQEYLLSAFENNEGRKETSFKLVYNGDDNINVVIDDTSYHLQVSWDKISPIIKGKLNNQEFVAQLHHDGIIYSLAFNGCATSHFIFDARIAPHFALMPFKRPPDMSKFLLSPMPGMVVRISVEQGQQVKAGEELAVIEAMKMENILHAEKDVEIDEVFVSSGDTLALDEKILSFK